MSASCSEAASLEVFDITIKNAVNILHQILNIVSIIPCVVSSALSCGGLFRASLRVRVVPENERGLKRGVVRSQVKRKQWYHGSCSKSEERKPGEAKVSLVLR